MTQSPLLKFVERLSVEEGAEYMTVAEVARRTGRSPGTIKRWIKAGHISGPSRKVERGAMIIYLYTEDDLKETQDFAQTMTPGRRTDLED